MKTRTIVISDLHLGGGESDPGDDHVYQGGQLRRFVLGLTASDAGQRGAIELYINGDFLEFAQTEQDAYRGKDAEFWCSEGESMQKLAAILKGHAPAFEALRALVEAGNAVTIAAGNHDVDLYWPAVQAELRRKVHPSLAFELGSEWVERHGGRLQISHGHIPDPANTFRHWGDPRMTDGDGTPRLEMCPGTLFMVKVVNALEHDYPFADNVHPIQRFAKLLARQETMDFFPVAWSFLRFGTRHPLIMSAQRDRYGEWLLERIGREDDLALALCAAAQADGAPPLSIEALRSSLGSEDDLAAFIIEHWSRLQATGVASRLQPVSSNVLGDGPAGNTLGKIKAGGDFDRESLQLAAKNRAAFHEATEVVVMGHTHIPDDCAVTHRARYYNPGSWTRYVDLEAHPDLKLSDLGKESSFPYSLRYVQIDAPPDGGPLVTLLEIFEEQAADFQSPQT